MNYGQMPKNVRISVSIPVSLMIKFERLAYENDKMPEDAIKYLIEESVSQNDLQKMQSEVETMCKECEFKAAAEEKDMVVRGFCIGDNEEEEEEEEECCGKGKKRPPKPSKKSK